MRPSFLFSRIAAFVFAALLVAVTAQATSTTGLRKNIRTTDGRINALDLTTNPQICSITLDDGTGETFTTPTTAAAIKSATLTLAGFTRGAATATAADGSCTVTVPGLYSVEACMGDGVGDNGATTTLSLFRKDGGGSATAIALGSAAVAVNTTAQIWHPMCARALQSVSVAQAASGQIFDGRITASTGSPEVKKYNLRVIKVDELQPASP